MPPILANDRPAPTDAPAPQALGARAIDRLAAPEGLPPDRRSAVRGMACPGHDPSGPAQRDLLPSLRPVPLGTTPVNG